MAIVQNPLISRASGTVGSSIFSKWKQKNTIRSKSINPYPSPSPAQQLCRDRFMYYSNFFSFVRSYIPVLFTSVSKKISPYNSCMRENISLFSGLGGLIPVGKVSSLKFSKGSLPKPYYFSYNIGYGEESVFNFSLEIYIEVESSDLQSILFIYNFSTHTLQIVNSLPNLFNLMTVPASFFTPGNNYFIFYSYYHIPLKLSSDSLFVCSFIY